MASHGAFPAEEFGSGSRPTPLVAVPAWLKQGSQPPPERVTLTPTDQAFLESAPTYAEGESLLPPEPAVLRAPSRLRRALSLLLFTLITGAASALLALAVLRMLGRSPFGW